MSDRPNLDKKLNIENFQKNYYLKEELVSFCRENGLPTTGSKAELTHRIIYYLDKKECITRPLIRKKRPTSSQITLDMKIGENFVCSEKHRQFYKEQIGHSFSFSVLFQRWLKVHPDQTYQQSIDAYFQILEEKKNRKFEIDPQFEYNTYIRDFFADNRDKTLEQAILCWKYKKNLAGSHRYAPEDLSVLVKK